MSAMQIQMKMRFHSLIASIALVPLLAMPLPTAHAERLLHRYYPMPCFKTTLSSLFCRIKVAMTEAAATLAPVVSRTVR